MSRLNANNKQIACIKEDVKISITERLDTFLRDDSRTGSSLIVGFNSYLISYLCPKPQKLCLSRVSHPMNANIYTTIASNSR